MILGNFSEQNLFHWRTKARSMLLRIVQTNINAITPETNMRTNSNEYAFSLGFKKHPELGELFFADRS
eukprot:1311055-Heterocapsa_arctica.AAC.1